MFIIGILKYILFVYFQEPFNYLEEQNELSKYRVNIIL